MSKHSYKAQGILLYLSDQKNEKLFMKCIVNLAAIDKLCDFY